jgi:hypothetical protein
MPPEYGDDSDEVDVLTNYHLEVTGTRELNGPSSVPSSSSLSSSSSSSSSRSGGASSAGVIAGSSGAETGERIVEYVVRVSTPDMAWTCYRCVIALCVHGSPSHFYLVNVLDTLT